METNPRKNNRHLKEATWKAKELMETNLKKTTSKQRKSWNQNEWKHRRTEGSQLKTIESCWDKPKEIQWQRTRRDTGETKGAQSFWLAFYIGPIGVSFVVIWVWFHSFSMAFLLLSLVCNRILLAFYCFSSSLAPLLFFVVRIVWFRLYLFIFPFVFIIISPLLLRGCVPLVCL